METNLPLFTETFLGMRLLHVDDLVNLVLRFSLNTIAVLILIGLLYYRQGGRKDYFFTSMVISVTVFLLCFLLESVKIQLGFALGLFAVFGIIRYRTEQIPIKEMTYLFAAIGLSIIGVNFGALIGIRGEYPNRRHWRNIVFHVFQMYSRMQNRQVLAVAAEAPGFALPAIGVVPMNQSSVE